MEMSANVVRLIQALHDSPLKLSFCVSGAGSAAIAALTRVSGCSRTLLHGEVLYSPAATTAALDYTPAHYVSARTARQLAQHALRTSDRLATAELRAGGAVTPVVLVGVGASSAVATSRQRRGVDQVYVSVWARPLRGDAPKVPDRTSPSRLGTPHASGLETGSERTTVLDAHLVLPAHLSRVEQDEQVSLLLLHAVGQLAAVVTSGACDGSTPGAPTDTADVCTDVWSGLAPRVGGLADGPSLCERPALSISGFTGNEGAVAVESVREGRCRAVVFNRFGEARTVAGPSFPWEPEEKEVVGEGRTDEGVLRVPPVRLLYPGSFRPLHWGHTELARAALEVASARAARGPQSSSASASLAPCGPARLTYEIAATIADKGVVSAESLLARVAQFMHRGERVAVTGATLFVDKAALFPGHGLIVGVDTARRILDPAYYPGGTEADMITALRRDIGGHGCYFVVGGRAVPRAGAASDGPAPTTWEDLSALPVPAALEDLFVSVPESRFRVDVSSTELRARADAARE